MPSGYDSYDSYDSYDMIHTKIKCNVCGSVQLLVDQLLVDLWHFEHFEISVVRTSS